jgi:hypothetical protein
MGRRTGNQRVVRELQAALTGFLDDHRKFAESDPEWMTEWNKMSAEERASEPGCGCEDCQLAGQLRGSIF